MNTKVSSSWARYTPRTSTRRPWHREAARALGEPVRKSGRFALRGSLGMIVTFATLTGGCGDVPSDQSELVAAPQRAPAALQAGSAGFKCHPFHKRSGGCGNSGGTSGAGGTTGGASGGVAGGAGGSGNTAGMLGSAGGAGAGGQAASDAPFAILAAADGPIAVATDGAAVVWLESTAVRTCPVSGCGAAAPAPLNAEPISDPVVDAVGIDQTSVYWLSSTLVQRCGRTGCAANETFATLPPNAIGAWSQLAVHGGIVYTETRTSVYQCPVGGCNQTPTAIFGRPDDWGTPFAVDDTGIFISITGEGYGTYYCPFGGCPPTIGEPLSTPGGKRLAAVSGTVYMWDQQGNITSCPSTGCPGGATSLAAAQTTLTSLGADASGVYWTTSDGTTGSVYKCALPACAGGPTALATEQANPVSLSVSDHLVVWANAGGTGVPGSIMGLAK